MNRGNSFRKQAMPDKTSSTSPNQLCLVGRAVLLCSVMMHVNVGWAQPNSTAGTDSSQHVAETIRELYVPFEELDVLLGSNSQRVYLTRTEFEQLQARAKQVPTPPVPIESTLVSATYQAKIEQGHAIILGELEIDVLVDGLQHFTLDMTGATIQRATMDGQPAAMAERSPAGVSIFVEGMGRHSLKLEMMASVSASAAVQSLAIQLPYAATSKLQVTTAGNVELKSGATLLTRSYSAEANETKFDLLLDKGIMSLVMSLNNRMLHEQAMLMARGVIIDEVTQTYERLHATMSFNVLQGATDRVRLQIPDDFDVSAVETPLLASWSIERINEQSVLVVKLRETIAQRIVLNANLVRLPAALNNWSLPKIRPLGVVSQTAVWGLLVEEGLTTDAIRHAGMIPVDRQVIRQTLEGRIQDEPGAPRLRAVAAYYAPQAEYALSAQFTKSAGSLMVATNLLMTIGDDALTLRGGFGLRSESEKIFSFDITGPALWQIESVGLADGTNLAFEKYPDENRTRYRVMFPSATPVFSQRDVVFQAKAVPAQWLSPWTQLEIDFPDFRVEDTTLDEGAIAVVVTDDLEARVASTTELRPLSEIDKTRFRLDGVSAAVSFSYQRRPWSATLEVNRPAPRVSARSLSFFKIQADHLAAHYELIFDVQQARAPFLSFSLPESTPAEISIGGLAGTQVKEFVSTLNQSRRVWKVTLAQPSSGTVRLAVDFTQPISAPFPLSYELPIAIAQDVSRQSGTIAIEGDPELDIVADNAPTAIDIGELVDAEYEVGKRLLGVFGYVGAGPRVSVQLARRSIHAIPSTLVDRAELLSLFSKSGVCQTAARFKMKTKSQYIEVVLPPGAELWTTLLDGAPALPQRRGERLMIPIPFEQTTRSRDLQLVYESRTSTFEHRGQIAVVAPKLAERESAALSATPIPVADLDWKVILPNGYTLAKSDGSVFVADSPTESWIPRLTDALSWVGGKYLPNFLAQSRSVSIAQQRADFDRARVEAITAESASQPAIAAEIRDGAVTTRPFGGGFPGAGFRGGGSGGAQPKSAPAGMGMDPLGRAADEFLGVQAKRSDREASAGEAASASPAEPPMPQIRLDATQQLQTLPTPADPFAAKEPNVGQSDPFAADNQVVFQTPQSSVDKAWALEGIRGLQIAFATEDAGPVFRLHSLGHEPSLRAIVVDQRRLNWLAWTVCIVAALLGIGLRNSTIRTKVGFVVFLVILAIACPLVIGYEREMESVVQYLIPLACVLPVFYAVCSGTRVLSTLIRQTVATTRTSLVRGKATASASIGLLIALTSATHVSAQSNPAVTEPVKLAEGVEQFLPLVEQRFSRVPVQLPDDVVVVPYDPKNLESATKTEKLLVPFNMFQRLWRAVHPEPSVRIPPLKYAISTGEFRAKLSDGDSLLISAVLNIDVFVKGDVAVPLPMEGAVLERTLLDGVAARIDVRSPQQAELKSPVNSLWLQVTGPGRKRLEFDARVKIDRRGGWRNSEAKLPHGAANSVTLIVSEKDTEVRFVDSVDQAAHEITTTQQEIHSVLGNDGAFAVQWRTKVAQSVADQSMSVVSQSIFDIQEDSLRWLWHGEFEFRRARRENFSINVPAEYVVEKVLGSNIRSWQAKPDGNSQRVEIQLLQAVADAENCTMVLARHSASHGGNREQLTAPVISVPEAKLHQGEITLRRSNLLDIELGNLSGLRRTDTRSQWDWMSPLHSDSPLPLNPFQTFQFTQTPYELTISVNAVRARLKVNTQTLLKIAEHETNVETRLILESLSRPLYHVRISLPEGLVVKRPVIAGEFEWNQRIENGSRQLDIFFADGKLGSFPVILRGSIKNSPPAADAADGQAMLPLALPRISIADAEQHEGDIVIQSEPAFEVSVENLQQAQSVLPDSVYNWLANSQRATLQAVVHFTSPDIAGQVRVTRRQPQISSYSVTNVRITDRAIEETIYLDFSIQVTGIEQIEFTVPRSMRDARIQSPLVRQKTITPIDDSADAPVRMRLDLQRNIMGQYRIVLSNDRELANTPQEVPLPIIHTGRTDRRLVTLENSGNDELVIVDERNVDRLQRSQALWKSLAELLGDKISDAFVALDGAEPTKLVYSTNSRTQVRTVGARIGLAKTDLTFDENGSYRARQEYRIENRTEQFLELQMPANSRLWTAWVADEPVKPIHPAAGSSAGAAASSVDTEKYLVRIPLVKTAEGDLDYGVVLKYGGQIPAPSNLQRVRFPLVRTTNIRAELSQVRLRLPFSQRWFNFDGTLGRVYDEGDFLADLLAYKNRQMSELSDLLSENSRANAYSKARAGNNLKQLELSLNQQSFGFGTNSSSGKLQSQLQANSMVIEQARQQLSLQDLELQRSSSLGNRESLSKQFDAQQNGSALGVVSQLEDNFASLVPDQQTAATEQFDKDWFERNELQKKIADAKESDKKSMADMMPKPFFEQKSASRLAESMPAEKEGLLAPEINTPTATDRSAGAKNEAESESREESSRRYLQRLQRNQQSAQQATPTINDAQPESAGRQAQAASADNPFSNETARGTEAPAAERGSSAVGYLTSLDVEIPQRGEVYLFTTPNGDLDLSAQSVSTDFLNRTKTIAAIGICIFAAWLAIRFWETCQNSSFARRFCAVALVLVGAVCLLTWTLPIYGLASLFASIGLAWYQPAQPHGS